MIPAPPLSLWALIELVGNHLWQSTVFLAAAGLLTLALRTNRAQVRYWVWLAASIKFLIPFAALVAVGGEFGLRPASDIVRPDMTLVIDAMSQPFSRPALRVAEPPTSSSLATALPNILLLVWFSGCAVILLTWWARWRRVAATVRAALPVNCGRELDALRRLERIGGGQRPLPLVSSDTSLEPGVFGILKPVLLWPRRIGEHLNDAQIEALVAHELSHVRRRDNLTASLHMLVEAILWFHPAVWWLGARLLDERERACDEEVIRSGTEPQVYAESILRTCKFCLQPRLECVAGITGSALKRRIERIMKNHAVQQLNTWRRLLLATAAVVTIAGPIAVGVLNARPLDTQPPTTDAGKLVFAVASVTPAADPRLYNVTISPDGRFVWKSVTLSRLIRTAHRTQDFQKMEGMPSWFNSDRFDIEGKAEGNPTEEQVWSMVWSLMADRFKLRTHLETRELPVYALVLARSDGGLGARIRPSECVAEDRISFPPGPVDPSRQIPLPCGGVRSMTLKGTIQARFATIAKLAGALSMLVRRPVHDRTGLAGRFDLEVEWTPAPGPPGPGVPGVGPAMLAAIEEQLGLRLEAQTGPADVLVIDHVEPPAPDKVP
jgi:bla regulator protein blaR1